MKKVYVIEFREKGKRRWRPYLTSFAFSKRAARKYLCNTQLPPGCEFQVVRFVAGCVVREQVT